MSPRSRTEDVDDVEDVDDDDDLPPPHAGPARTDGSTELNQRDTFRMLFSDPAVRNYVFAAFSALAMIFLCLFQQGSDLGGLLIVVLGAAGIVLRWSPASPLILLVLLYFMIFPFGIPGEAYENRFEIEDGRFRFVDIFLVMSVLVYIASQYRVLGIVSQAVAFEGMGRRKDETAARRPPALITKLEVGVMLGVAAVVVVVGQLIWWVVTSVELTPTADFPLRWVGAGRTTRRFEPPGGLPPRGTYFVLFVGILLFVTLIGRLIFGYWRLRMMGPAEGAMILLDGGWVETRRERSRQEKWRLWGRKRRAAQAEAEAKAEAIAARKVARTETKRKKR